MNPFKKDTGNSNKSKLPFRFNLYWMYALIFIMLFTLYITNDSSASKEIGWTQFQGLARENIFDKMTVFNKKNMLEAVVRPDKVDSVFEGAKKQVGASHKVYVKIPSADKFSDFFDNAVKEEGITTQVSYEEGDNVFLDFLISFGPLILLIVVWIFLMRKMSGGAAGGGGGGGVFNVGKSKAQLFDKDNDKRVTFKDVAR